MNYLGLVAICLGLVAILVSIQYMNSTDRILVELKYIKKKCINNDNANDNTNDNANDNTNDNANEKFKNYNSKLIYQNLKSRDIEPKICKLSNSKTNLYDLMDFDKSYYNRF